MLLGIWERNRKTVLFATLFAHDREQGAVESARDRGALLHSAGELLWPMRSAIVSPSSTNCGKLRLIRPGTRAHHDHAAAGENCLFDVAIRPTESCAR